MPKDFDNYNNLNTGNNQSYRASRRSTIKTVDPDVSGARKAYDDIFSYAKKSATDFNKLYIKDTATTMKTVANITLNTYSKMFKSMESMHKTYLDNMIKREFSAASEVSKAWSNARSGSPVGSPPRSQGNSGDYGIGDSMRGISNSIDNSLGKFTRDNERILEKSSDGIGEKTGSAFSKVGTKLLGIAKQYLDIWLQRFQRGIDNIYNTYEETYTNVSVLMRQNQAQYIKWQTVATDEITNRGLKDNVAISEVMKTMSQVVSMGISGQEAQNKALADTINKTIAPFVETTSDAYTDLQLRLGKDFIDPITGMGAAIADQVGSARVFNKSINQIIEMLNPIMLNAQSEYAQNNLADTVAMLEASGFSTADATEYAYKMANIAKNPYEALTSGDIESAVVAATSKDVTNILENLKAGRSFQTGIMSGSQGLSAIGLSAITSNVGMGGTWAYYMNGNNPWDETYNVGGIDSTLAGNVQRRRFADNDYTTVTAQRAIWSENSMLGIAQFREQYPDAYDLLSKITTSVMSMAGSQIFNSLTGGKGLLGEGGFGGLKTSLSKLGAGIKQLPATLSKGIHAAGEAMSSGTLGSAVGPAAAIAGGAIVAKMGADEIASGQEKLKYKRDLDTGRAQTALGMGAMVGGGIAAGAGVAGIASMAAAGAGAGLMTGLAAVGPVGWIALAAGGVAIAISKTVEHYSKLNKAVNEVKDKYAEQRMAMEEENLERKAAIESLREQYDETSSLEDKRKLLIEQGVATEEELANKTSVAIDNIFSTYEEQQKKIANDGMEEWQKFFTETLDIFDLVPDSLGDAFYRKLQEEDEKVTEENQKLFAHDLAKQLAGLNPEERKEYLEDLGVDFNSTDLKDAAIATILAGSTDENQIAAALTQRRGLANEKDSYVQGLDTESLNLMISKHNMSTSEFSDRSDIGSEIARAIDFLKPYIDMPPVQRESKIKGDLKNDYNEALDVVQSKEAIEVAESIGMGAKLLPFQNFKRLASGTPYVSEDGLAFLHQGEAVLNKYQNRDYMRASAVTSLFGTGSSALEILSRSRSSNESTDGNYTEITDAISACAKLIVDAISNRQDTSQARASLLDRIGKGPSMEDLSRLFYSRQRTNITEELSNMINLQPSMVG